MNPPPPPPLPFQPGTRTKEPFAELPYSDVGDIDYITFFVLYLQKLLEDVGCLTILDQVEKERKRGRFDGHLDHVSLFFIY